MYQLNNYFDGVEMRFPPLPTESKKQINRAGKLIGEGITSETELAQAVDLVNRWRACHSYPINTFQATLRTKLRKYPGEVIVAQRLKRMPTIIDKLQRYPAMQLTTMQDIGGIRAILNSIADVDQLVNEYRDGSRFLHELVDERDYISSPRDEDGYRSCHLVYKYRNPLHPQYDGLRVELQIRTRLQHIWATAVETMGTFLGQALKSRQGDQAWLDFFAITSSAFAYHENCPPIPRFGHLTREETCNAVAQAEAGIGALDKMHMFSIAVNQISGDHGSNQAYTYHLIVLDSLNRNATIYAFGRENYEQALQEFAHAEEQAAQGAKIEPVLVSAGRIDILRRAYPNFFLDIEEFSQLVSEIVKPASEN
ncbi:MAG: RelA/SpoT domain-containing protein [Anaerolineaceae bacterium]|nr:RelA/SpoT domain-containing protein [Anaerolineaceae bacterium]